MARVHDMRACHSGIFGPVCRVYPAGGGMFTFRLDKREGEPAVSDVILAKLNGADVRVVIREFHYAGSSELGYSIWEGAAAEDCPADQHVPLL